jgi:integrase
MNTLTNPPVQAPALLNLEDRAALNELYSRGTPENTRRAYERDLLYITAWKHASFGRPLTWPEVEDVALRFILDHSRDLSGGDSKAREVAEILCAAGLRRGLACPSAATLDRRIASWRALHRMRNLASPFEAPLLRQARSKARRATAAPLAPKSENPITRDILRALLAATGPDLRGLRDRALLLLGWASGGRRRSEITSLFREDISLIDFDAKGIVWIQLLRTKTTQTGSVPRLVLKAQAARAVVAWIDAAKISHGPLFRRVTRTDAVGKNALSDAAVGQIIKRLLVAAGLPKTFASAHGLRSGFLTQAALDGAPIQAAMRLSLHRSMAQALRYYADVDIADNPAADLLSRD